MQLHRTWAAPMVVHSQSATLGILPSKTPIPPKGVSLSTLFRLLLFWG